MLIGSLFSAQNVVVVVDDSGSMADRMRHEKVRKIDAAKQALSVVLDRLPRSANVGVLALNDGWILPLQNSDRSQVKQRVNQLRARGGTPLGTRMKEAADELLTKRAKEMYGDYRLLVVTDGEASDQAVLDFVLPDIMSRGLLVDVIGVDMKSEHSLATLVHSYRRADDPESLKEAIAKSLAESDEADVVGGDSDFELLEGFPLDVAPTVISALTSMNNTPIGGAEFDSAQYDGAGVGFPPNKPGGGGSGGAVFGFTAFFCMGFLVFLIATVSLMLKAVGRRRN
jgi:uncharacterized protein YegL